MVKIAKILRITGIGLFLILLNCAQTFAQYTTKSEKARASFNQAVKTFQASNWEQTEKHARKAISEDPVWNEPYALLANVFRRTNEHEKELQLYNEQIAANPNVFDGYYNKAEFHASRGEFKDAIESYRKALELPGIPPKFKTHTQAELKRLETANRLIDAPVPFDPKNVGGGVNSKLDEYFPVFTVDGKNMYFTRKKVVDSIRTPTGAYYYRYNEDLMVSRKNTDGSWGKATELPGVNTADNEGAMAISPDGYYLIFTGCEREDGMGSCDLYISFNLNGKWTKPVNMGDPINTRWKETQPTISYDGRTIYFASNRPGSIGGLDIWKSTRDDKWNFSTPENLGNVINTKEDDQTPYIHPDNQTLYFCSRGHAGLGMNDIFYSRKKEDGSWGEVVNIGYPINTPGDEPGIMIEPSGEYAYISSSGTNGFGGLDILSFKLHEAARPRPVAYLQGKVYDAYTKQPLESVFELVDLESGETMLQTSTAKDGSFLVPLPGNIDYLLNVNSKNYLFYSENLQLKGYTKPEPYEADIPLYPIKSGEKVALRNIFFETDAFKLKPESKNELQRLVTFLKTNTTVKIEISGHTDNTGSATHNQQLSQNRAKSVYDYLVKEGGIDASRLTFKGYGSTQPIAENNTEAGKAKNRRTEIKIQ